MKTSRRGFTLAELLICMAIIGTIAAMGMVITKRSTESAYNLYYYTGYINLYNAIAEARANGCETASCTMEYAMDLLNGDTPSVSNTAADSDLVSITMNVPQPKTNSNPDGMSDNLTMVYTTDNGGLLIPQGDLLTRRDLLPVYIDDGTVGRHMGGTYTRPAYYSYQEAYCRLYGSSLSKTSNNVSVAISCSGYSQDGSSGVLKVTDPRKAR